MQRSLHITSVSFHNLQERAFFALIFLIAAVAASYLYMVSTAVMRVVDRTEALAEAKVLDTKISELESEYMASGAVIGLSDAKILGYEEIAKIEYVSRVASLSFAHP